MNDEDDLRKLYAGLALVGLLARSRESYESWTEAARDGALNNEMIVKRAVKCADALIEELKREQG